MRTGLKEEQTSLACPLPGNPGDWKIGIGDRAHKTAGTGPVLSVSNLRARKGPPKAGLCAACGEVRKFTECVAGAGGFEPPYGGIKIQVLVLISQRSFRKFARNRSVSRQRDSLNFGMANADPDGFPGSKNA